MRLIFLGSGAFAQPTLRWLAASEHEIVRVITQPARGSGRGRRVTRTPVQALAEELNLPVSAFEDINAPEVVTDLRALNASLGVVIAFGQRIGKELRESLPGGFINLHASLLPKYRGAAPINWAIIRREELTGCTVFRIVGPMDAGPILARDVTEIKPLETAGELHDRLAEIGVNTVQKALELFSGGHVPEGTPQLESEASKAPKLSKGDGLVDFGDEAGTVTARIHGLTPWREPPRDSKPKTAAGRM
jgi:methionyl-tRNA formyltransferase